MQGYSEKKGFAKLLEKDRLTYRDRIKLKLALETINLRLSFLEDRSNTSFSKQDKLLAEYKTVHKKTDKEVRDFCQMIIGDDYRGTKNRDHLKQLKRKIIKKMRDS